MLTPGLSDIFYANKDAFTKAHIGKDLGMHVLHVPNDRIIIFWKRDIAIKDFLFSIFLKLRRMFLLLHMIFEMLDYDILIFLCF